MKRSCVFWVYVVILVSGLWAETYEEPAGQAVARDAANAVIAGDYDKLIGMFDEQLKETAQITADVMRSAVDSYTQKTGTFTKITDIISVTRKGVSFTLVTCVCEKGVLLDIAIGVNAREKIISFLFKMPKDDFTYRAPAYADITKFTEEIVTFGGDYPLPATLTVPNKKGKHPVVILVHGSGPNDRDETIGRNKPFRDIAWGLASEGIAVFRYEKRTRLYSTFESCSTPQTEVVDDVLEAVKWLKTRNDISSIYILGHSLGAMMMPAIIEQDGGTCKGFIMCGAPARKLETLMEEQYAYIFSLDGKISKVEQRMLDSTKEQAQIIRDGMYDPQELRATLLNIPVEYWIALTAYDQVAKLKTAECPVFLMQGEADYQVTMEDYRLWQKALFDKKNITMRSYPLLNHLYIKGAEKSKPADYDAEGHIDNAVIRDIISWIKNTERK